MLIMSTRSATVSLSLFSAWLLIVRPRLDRLFVSVETTHTHSAGFRVVLPWYDGLEPDLARGWSLARSGRLERKEVIACVVRTRGGLPNGSRRVARRAAALLDHNLTVRIDRV